MKSSAISYLRLLALLLILLLITVNRAHAAPPLQTPDAILRIFNDSDHTICSVYVVTDSTLGDDWRDFFRDLLGDDTIPPGETFSFDLPRGDYNVFLQDCDGNPLLEARGITISGLYELRFTDSSVCRTLDNQAVTLLNQGHFAESLSELQLVLACYRDTDDRPRELSTLNLIAYVHFIQEQYWEALPYFQQCLTIAREIGDHDAEAIALKGIGGICYYGLGQYPDAEHYVQQAEAMLDPCLILISEGEFLLSEARYAEALEKLQEAVACYGGADVHNWAVMRALGNIGSIYEGLGQYQEALGYYQQALNIAEGISHCDNQSAILNHIGLIYNVLGQHWQALDYFLQALTIAQEMDDRPAEGVAIHNIGSMYAYLGRQQEALEYQQQALAYARESGDRTVESRALNDIGFVHFTLGRFPEALEYFEQALAIKQEIGDLAGRGTTLANIGAVYLDMGQYQDALDYHQQSLTILQEVGDRAGECITLNNMAGVYSALGQHEEGLHYCQQALTVAREIGSRAGEAKALAGIGVIHSSLGQYQEALDYHQQSLTILQEVGDRAGECITLNNIGGVYSALGQYEEGLHYCQQALNMAREIGNRAGEAEALAGIGGIHSSLGQYQEALDYHQQSLTILQEIGDRAGEGTTLNQMGSIYHDLGQYQESLQYCQRALTIAREIGNRDGEGSALNNIGNFYQSQGQYQEALDYYQHALAVSQEIGDLSGTGVSLSNIGEIHRSTGRYPEALDYYQQALDVLEETGDQTEESTVLNNIAVTHSHMGNYQEALHYGQQALAIAREIGDRAGEAGPLNTIGGTYESLGQYREAIEYYLRSLTMLREVSSRRGEGTLLNNIGGVYHSLGQHQKALDYCQQALTAAQESGEQAAENASLLRIGTIYQDLEQYQEALDCYQQALTICREIGDRSGEGTALNNVGGLYLDKGQHLEALKYLQRSLIILQEISDPDKEGLTLNNIGVTYLHLRRYEEALDYFRQAVAITESMRGEMTVGEFKSGFAAERTNVYRHIIGLLLQMERHDEAFDYVQRAKARTFLDRLGNMRLEPFPGKNLHLAEREATLRSEVQALNVLLHEEWAKPPDQRSDEVIQSLTAQLEQKRNTYTQLLPRLKLEDPEYASLVTVDTLSLTQTQRLLTGTTLIEYYILSSTQTLAFVVTPDDLHLERIAVSSQSLMQSLLDFYSFPNLDTKAVPESMHTLYELLIAPIENCLHTNKLIIAPHSVLHYVPFAGLHDGTDYLMEKHILVQFPSVSTLPFILRKHKASIGPPLILGDPDSSLPFSRREAQAVAKRYHTTAHVGEQALEELVWEQGPDAGILHLSAHGIYDQLSPLFSCILLASDTEGRYDGFLEVHEVYNLDLRKVDLVVLSACQTNLGELSAGDEIVGLTRAFIYAGTPSVLATLWNVEDRATEDLVVAFYRYLDEGYTKGEALSQAQADMLGNPQRVHPYYWAGFVLTGDAGPLGEIKPTGVLATGIAIWPLRALLALALSVGIWAWRKKHKENTLCGQTGAPSD